MPYSANVTQVGNILTFTDTSTISGSLVSRTLVIKDANGVTLITVSLGATLTYNYTITSDQYLTFLETIVDGSGSHPVEVDKMSVYFYITTFLAIMKQAGCSCSYSVYKKLNEAGNYFDAANDYALMAGYGVLANANIIDANIILNS